MDNVITLNKLLLLFCPPPHCFDFENSKNTRNELARPVMGTIFLVFLSISNCRAREQLCMHICIIYAVTIKQT